MNKLKELKLFAERLQAERDALKKELNESRKNDLTNHHYLHAIRDALDCNEMNYPTLVEYCKKLDKKLNAMKEEK